MSTVVDNKGLEAPSPFKTFMKNNMQLMLVTVALFVILLFFSIAANGFAKPNIYLDIVLQSAYTGVMALGATFVIATSGIDLSVGTGMSLVAVMAGIFLAANLRSSAPTIGDPFTLKIVAACALGGTSLAGGKGGVVNTIVGVLIMTVLDNGLVMLNVNPNIRTGVQGVIILVAVILTAARGAKVISK